MLDQIEGDADPTELFQSGKLMAKVRRWSIPRSRMIRYVKRSLNTVPNSRRAQTARRLYPKYG